MPWGQNGTDLYFENEMSLFPKPVSLKRAIRNASRMGKPMTPAEKLLDRAYKLLARKK